MALTTTKYGNYTLLEGTALEVAEGLNANNVPKDKVIGIGEKVGPFWILKTQ